MHFEVISAKNGLLEFFVGQILMGFLEVVGGFAFVLVANDRKRQNK